MKLEEVEKKLGEIYSLASGAQSKVRALMTGSAEGVTLTSTQKEKIKTKVKEDITNIGNRAKEILEGLG